MADRSASLEPAAQEFYRWTSFELRADPGVVEAIAALSAERIREAVAEILERHGHTPAAEAEALAVFDPWSEQTGRD